MSFFKQIDGESAVIVEGGVYKQVDLYTRDGYVFAKAAGGFVRIMADGTTSKAGGKLRVDFLSYAGPLFRDSLNRLRIEEGRDAKRLDVGQSQKLLGGSNG